MSCLYTLQNDLLAPTSYYQPPPQHRYKKGYELSQLCSTIARIMCDSNLVWDMDRQLNFSLFCNRLLMQMNIPAPVVYTSLKYLQCILVNSVNQYNNMIDLSDIAHEYSLVTVTLLLAYKFHEDNPPHMSQWSFASLISIDELVLLESQVLQRLNYSLNISVPVFDEWAEVCNTIYDMPYLDVNVFDLHMTQSRLGYSMLLPVLLDDFYFAQQPPLITSQSSSPTLSDSYQMMYQKEDYLLLETQKDHRSIIPSWLQYQQEFPIQMDHLYYFQNALIS